MYIITYIEPNYSLSKRYWGSKEAEQADLIKSIRWKKKKPIVTERSQESEDHYQLARADS